MTPLTIGGNYHQRSRSQYREAHRSRRSTRRNPVEPPVVSMGQFSVADPLSYEVKLWSYLPDPWKMTGFECAHPETADHFDVEARDMTQEEVDRVQGAQNGQVLRILVKPGLPWQSDTKRFESPIIMGNAVP